MTVSVGGQRHDLIVGRSLTVMGSDGAGGR
jgi:hypothetical protein